MNNTPNFNHQDVEENKVVAILMAIFPILFFLPMAMGKSSTSPYLRYRANQSLVFFIAAILLNVVINVISLIPLLGWIAGGVIGFIVGLIEIIYWIYGIVTVASGANGKYFLIGEIELLK